MKLSPAIVSKFLSISPHAVRMGMRCGKLPFGAAFIKESRYVYDIRPWMVAEYLGITVEELEEKVRRIA